MTAPVCLSALLHFPAVLTPCPAAAAAGHFPSAARHVTARLGSSRHFTVRPGAALAPLLLKAKHDQGWMDVMMTEALSLPRRAERLEGREPPSSRDSV